MNIASENKKMTIDKISKRSHITRTTIKNNFNIGSLGIIEYIYLNIVDKIIFKYNIEELSILLNLLLNLQVRLAKELGVGQNSDLII